jgi:hypothetical protein
MDAHEAETQIAWMAEQLEAWRRSGEPAAAFARRLALALNGPAPSAPPGLFFEPDAAPMKRCVGC